MSGLDTSAFLEQIRKKKTPLGDKEKAISLIRNVYAQYPHDKIGISFNGGKDSVAILELVREAVGIEVLKESIVFFLDTGDDFPEMIDFRNKFEKERLPGVTLHRIEASAGLCDGLWTVKKMFGIDAVLMGTRCTDPSGEYQRGECEPTTAGWPPMMRVCPVFFWTANDIWCYTLEHDLPFCTLYSRGFTSLGGSQVTSPNDALRNDDGSFAPAWLLDSNQNERSGRLR